MKKEHIIREFLRKHPYAQTKYVAERCGCSRRWVREIRAEMKAHEGKAPNILLFDIETSPMEVYVWGLYKQRINPDNIIKDWSVLSWSAKWLFDSKVMGEVVTPEEAIARDDWRILEELWHLLEEADICIGHNSRRFDHRKLNARFILNDRKPPMPYQTIDTKVEGMKHFAFASHKLNYLAQLLTGKEKLETDFKLWKQCVTGDQGALDRMLEYNKHDVLLTEEVFVELSPWIKSIPNMGLYVQADGEVCSNPVCGSKDLDWRGRYYTPAGRFEAFRCLNCGAIGRGRLSDLSKEERERLTLSVAR